MPYEPIIPEGQHLGASHEVDGAVVGHLFDDEGNKLQGHAAWRWVDEPEASEDFSYSADEESVELTPEQREIAELLGALIVLGIVAAVTKAKPHVQGWMEETVVPAVKSVWKRIVPARRAKNQMADAAPQPSDVLVASTSDIERSIEAPTFIMTLDEWSKRYGAMMEAGAFRDEQIRILSNARIENPDAALAPADGSEELTARQYADRIQMTLEANPSLLDPEASKDLIRVLGERLDLPAAPSRPALER